MPGNVLSLLLAVATLASLMSAAAQTPLVPTPAQTPLVPTTAQTPLVPAALAPLVRGGVLQPPWRVVTLPQQTLPVTRYSAETVDGREALRIESRGSYGNLVHELQPGESPETLRWAWRLTQPNPAMDLRTKAGDDVPVRVCASFDLPLERVPFVERQLLRLARGKTNEPLPAATLCWVWGHAEAPGALLPNAYTRRVRYIVLRNAQHESGRWFEESRDIAADFQRAFGDESATLPPLTALIVAGDADNTGGVSIAHVSGLRWGP